MKKVVLILIVLIIGLFLFGCTQESDRLNKAQSVQVHPEFGFDGRTINCNTVCSERNSTCIFAMAAINKSVQWDFDKGHFNSDYSEDRQIVICDTERKIEKLTMDTNDFRSTQIITLECRCIS